MSSKSKPYDKLIAEHMRDQEFAKGVVLHSLECGDSIEEALRLAIRSMGIKEFANKSGISTQRVSAFVAGQRSLELNNLVNGLSVFGLKLSVVDKVA